MSAVLFRADSSAEFGMGHLMRVLGLAQAAREAGIKPVVVTQILPGHGADLVRRKGFSVIELPSGIKYSDDARVTAEAAKANGVHWVVLDLHHAKTLGAPAIFMQYLDLLKETGLKVAVIEGMGAECLSQVQVLNADMVIVPYFGAETLKYQLRPGTKLLCGAAYFVLRDEFTRNARQARVTAAQVKRVLISMGGGDTAHANQKVLRAIGAIQGLNIHIKVTGQLAQDDIKQCPYPVEVIAKSQDMPGLITWADIAVIGSGLTRYETAFLGTPALVVSLNSVHASIVDAFARSGAITHAGIEDQVDSADIARCLREMMDDYNLRAQMAQCGRALIDGQGAARIIKELV